jgi:hypothetical protein
MTSPLNTSMSSDQKQMCKKKVRFWDEMNDVGLLSKTQIAHNDYPICLEKKTTPKTCLNNILESIRSSIKHYSHLQDDSKSPQCEIDAIRRISVAKSQFKKRTFDNLPKSKRVCDAVIYIYDFIARYEYEHYRNHMMSIGQPWKLLHELSEDVISYVSDSRPIIERFCDVINHQVTLYEEVFPHDEETNIQIVQACKSYISLLDSYQELAEKKLSVVSFTIDALEKIVDVRSPPVDDLSKLLLIIDGKNLIDEIDSDDEDANEYIFVEDHDADP